MKNLFPLVQSILSSLTFMFICGCTTNSVQSDIGSDSIPIPQHIGLHADRMLKKMGDYLKNSEAFTFEAESSYDALDYNGQHIRYGGKTKVSLQRPNHVYSEFDGDERRTASYYNGNTITVYNKESSMYAVMDMPPVIDDAIDKLMAKLGISLPLADLLYSDPYAVLSENIIEGRWVGLHTINGIPCNHLAFTQEFIDWQLWIEAGETPIPRQVLIIYKDEPGCPQYLARIKSWNFNPKFPPNHFKFTPPKGSGEIEFMTAADKEAENE